MDKQMSFDEEARRCLKKGIDTLAEFGSRSRSDPNSAHICEGHLMASPVSSSSSASSSQDAAPPRRALPQVGTPVRSPRRNLRAWSTSAGDASSIWSAGVPARQRSCWSRVSSPLPIPGVL
jgi:hypothetical protein